MRKIKFRAWDKEKNEIKNVRTLLFDRENNCMRVVLCNCPKEDLPVKNFKLMQFTGLKDKNGKEIYEGDILYRNYYGGERGIVKWDKSNTSFYLKVKGDTHLLPLGEDSEIIGNIYEKRKPRIIN